MTPKKSKVLIYTAPKASKNLKSAVHNKIGIEELDFNIKVSPKQFEETTLSRMAHYQKLKACKKEKIRQEVENGLEKQLQEGYQQLENLRRKSMGKRRQRSSKSLRDQSKVRKSGSSRKTRSRKSSKGRSRMVDRAKQFYIQKGKHLKDIKDGLREDRGEKRGKAGGNDKECTFQPRINEVSKGMKRGYTQLQKWQKQKMEHIDQIKQQLNPSKTKKRSKKAKKINYSRRKSSTKGTISKIGQNQKNLRKKVKTVKKSSGVRKDIVSMKNKILNEVHGQSLIHENPLNLKNYKNINNQVRNADTNRSDEYKYELYKDNENKIQNISDNQKDFQSGS